MLHSPHQHKATQFTAINTRSVMRFVLKKTVYLCDMLSYALRSIFFKVLFDNQTWFVGKPSIYFDDFRTKTSIGSSGISSPPRLSSKIPSQWLFRWSALPLLSSNNEWPAKKKKPIGKTHGDRPEGPILHGNHGISLVISRFEAG